MLRDGTGPRPRTGPATARLARPRQRKLAKYPALAALVQGWLKLKWSPEQISAALRVCFPNDPTRWLAAESIYQALYANEPVLQRDPRDCLRTERRRRRPRRRHDRRSSRADSGPAARPSIRERPAEAETRQVAGHWEGDPITGAANRSAIATLVDRASGCTILVHLPGRHTAQVTTAALTTAISQLPLSLRRSLTWDCGTELAEHHKITAVTGIEIFFAHPHSPWQRGSNENTNGLTRQYFPKGTNLAVHPPEHLARVQDELNGRPRKRHLWATPTARLDALRKDALQFPNQ